MPGEAVGIGRLLERNRRHGPKTVNDKALSGTASFISRGHGDFGRPRSGIPKKAQNDDVDEGTDSSFSTWTRQEIIRWRSLVFD